MVTLTIFEKLAIVFVWWWVIVGLAALSDRIYVNWRDRRDANRREADRTGQRAGA